MPDFICIAHFKIHLKLNYTNYAPILLKVILIKIFLNHFKKQA